MQTIVEEVNVVTCPKCGAVEELSVDEQRHHMQNFEWQRNFNDGTALYRCVCGKSVRSKIENNYTE